MTHPEQGWTEHVNDSLTEAGLQRSEPRQRVIRYLAARDCAVTALEIDAELDGIGRATVYRTIEQLEKLNLIQAVDLGGSALGYEKRDPAGHHHHHLVCDRCGRVVPFEDASLERAIHAFRHPDFRIETHDITLHGVCADCARQAT